MRIWKEKEGGRLKHCNVDGDVPLCLRSFDEENKEQQQQQRKQQRKDGERKQRWMTAEAKWQAEAKICAAIPLKRKTKNMEAKSKDITFIVLQKQGAYEPRISMKERPAECSFGNPKRRISEVMSDHSLSSQMCDYSHRDFFPMQVVTFNIWVYAFFLTKWLDEVFCLSNDGSLPVPCLFFPVTCLSLVIWISSHAILMSETWRPDKSEIWETHQKHIHGCRKIWQQTRSWNYAEQEVAAKTIDTECINWRSITATIVVNHQRIKTDECLLHPLGRWKNVQNSREAHDKLQKLHTDCWRRLQCWAGTRMRNWMYKCWQTHTQRRKQERWLDETLDDAARLHSTQHDVQENTSETNDLHFSKRKRKTNWLHSDQEETPEIQQRWRSQRHDPHGQWPKMCHDNIHDHYSEEGWPS